MPRPRDHREEFGRPVYGSLRQLLSDQARNVGRMARMRRNARRGLMTRAFRTRLMLAHTHVNECRYCSWFHARVALKEGIDRGQVDALLGGVVADAPPEETTALLYAIHFAESDGNPDVEARTRMDEVYGKERAEAIDTALRVIRSGNLMGNSLDYLLFRISWGRWGYREHIPRREPELEREVAIID